MRRDDELATWIRDTLAARGVSQSELAYRLGLERVVTNKVRQGRRQLFVDEFLKIQIALGTTFEGEPIELPSPTSTTIKDVIATPRLEIARLSGLPVASVRVRVEIEPQP